MLLQCSVALSQDESSIDSLLQAPYAAASMEHKVQAYQSIVEYYRNKDLSKALKCADTLQPLVSELRDAKIKAELHYILHIFVA